MDELTSHEKKIDSTLKVSCALVRAFITTCALFLCSCEAHVVMSVFVESK